uniref:B30.2/SPRY domain-containing protein n=1 Tax=Oncorhynchus mykiss TaxID=8022 RepID=A0A8K9XU15_ONCMY
SDRPQGSQHHPSEEGRALSELETKWNGVMGKSVLGGEELNRIQQDAVDVTLDPDTAHPQLIVSGDGKKVLYVHKEPNHPYNPKRCQGRVSVLAKEGFSSGRFYYGLYMGSKNGWNVGVAKESIDRAHGGLYPEEGFWTVWSFKNGPRGFCTSPHTSLSLKSKPQKVGVFVDYEEGQVSFYDVEAKSHIYSFTGCTFTEKLYPYLNPFDDYDGINPGPLVITPVNLTNRGRHFDSAKP